MARFRIVQSLVWAALLGVAGLASAAAFDFDAVALRAKRLAAKPYQAPESNVPQNLQSLDYERYREIRFRPESALWRQAHLGFEVGFFHQGRHYDRPVRINEVREDGVHEIRFRPELFDYGANKVDPGKLRNLGFAGFRVQYPVNSPKEMDEVLSFLGASYFRALGRHQRYGLSARALAIDTAVGSGEEFPRFVEFWVERPARRAKQLVVYGLLDSRRASGAYRFVLTPGTDTVLDVRARLYFRERVGKPGFAPLTSMFLFGENQPAAHEDYRPEVHDSDGLSVHAGSGEWLWRPLMNPRRLLVTSFETTDPRGFGLMQRDRAFASYQDTDQRYELRPSAWVEPKGAWGPGRVELVQIPVPDETNDNIVAYWVPREAPQPGQPFDIEYRLHWQKDAATRPALAWVAQTRRGARGVTRAGKDKEKDKEKDGQAFVLDFVGAPPKAAPDAKPQSVAWVDANGRLIENTLSRNDATGGWRVRLRVQRIDPKKPVELRVALREGENPWSETWSYIFPAD
jgi:glucans biosynthesis protein